MTNAELELLGKVIRYLENSPVATPLDQSVSDLLVPLAVSLGFVNGNALRDALRDNPSLALSRAVKYVAENSSGDCPDCPEPPGDRVVWEPSNISINDKLGIVAFSNTSNLIGITSVEILDSTNEQGYDFENCPDLVSLSFPNLSLITGRGYIYITGCNALESISLISLLQSSSTNSQPININNNTSLSEILLDNWLPVDTLNYIFNGNNLSATTVNSILARCVANAGYASGNLLLDGGTNAAPTGQGITDATTLVNRGVTVTTN